MFERAKDKCCICYDPKIDALIYQSKATLEKLSNEIIKSKFYGYSCDKKAEDKMDLLQNYLRVLTEENRKIALGGKPCLDCNNLQFLAEKVRKITTNCDIEARRDLIIDSSNRDSWIAQNPFCVSRESWERIAYQVCDAFNLDIKLIQIDDDCDITLEVLTKEQMCDITFEIVRKLIPCDIMLAISIYEEMCDLNFEITRTEEECKIDFDLLIEEVPCDITFDLYSKLIECNLSFDIIKTVYENGCSFEAQGQVLNLVTPLNKYPVKALSFKNTGLDIKTLKKLGVDMSDSQYLQNPKKFIDKLKQDYRGEF